MGTPAEHLPHRVLERSFAKPASVDEADAASERWLPAGKKSVRCTPGAYAQSFIENTQ